MNTDSFKVSNMNYAIIGLSRLIKNCNSVFINDTEYRYISNCRLILSDPTNCIITVDDTLYNTKIDLFISLNESKLLLKNIFKKILPIINSKLFTMHDMSRYITFHLNGNNLNMILTYNTLQLTDMNRDMILFSFILQVMFQYLRQEVYTKIKLGYICLNSDFLLSPISHDKSIRKISNCNTNDLHEKRFKIKADILDDIFNNKKESKTMQMLLSGITIKNIDFGI